MTSDGIAQEQIESSIEETFGLIKILTLGVKSLDAHLKQVRTYDPNNIVDVADVDEARKNLEKGGLDVIVSNSEEATSLVDMGTPIIGLFDKFNLDEVLHCYGGGFFDCVWKGDDLLLPIYYAYLAGNDARESKGQLNIYEIRKQQPFLLMVNKDPWFLRSPKPSHDQFKKGFKEHGFVVKDIGDNINGIENLITAVKPRRLLINVDLFKDADEGYLKKLTSTAVEYNPACSIIFIGDQQPSLSVSYMVGAGVASFFKRDSTLEHFITAHLVPEKGKLSYRESVDTIKEEVPAYWGGRIWHPQIESAYNRGLWADSSTQELVKLAQAGYSRFWEIVQKKLRGKKRPLFRWVDEECREGVIEALNPNRVYRSKEASEIWKLTDSHSAWQLYHDSKKRKEHGVAFQQPEVKIPIPFEGDQWFLVEEAIVGPNLREVFSRLFESESEPQKEEMDTNYFRELLYEIEIGKLLYFQQNFTELGGIPGRSLDLEKLRDPAYIISMYINNFVKAFEDISRYTNVNFNGDDINNIRSVLTDYGFGFITQNTIRRNLAASFRNSILRTNHVSKPLVEIYNKFISPSSRDKAVENMKRMLYRVDQAPKFSFLMEDVCEMLYFYEAHLPEDQRQKIAEKVIADHPQIKGELEEGFMPIALYRNIREADLFLDVYGPKITKKLADGFVDQEAYDLRLKAYERIIRMHNTTAGDVCNSLQPGHPLKALLPYIEKSFSFEKINYLTIDKTK